MGGQYTHYRVYATACSREMRTAARCSRNAMGSISNIQFDSSFIPVGKIAQQEGHIHPRSALLFVLHQICVPRVYHSYDTWYRNPRR